MRLLVTAFSLCPGEGSEPGVGWHAVCALAREHEVHVLVDANWEQKLNARFDAARHPAIHLHFVGLPLLTQLVNGPLNNGPGWLVYYYLWQIAAFWHARRLHRVWRFDATRHVTYVKYNVPGALAFLPVPFTFGPVGGGEHAPMAFFREFGWKTRLAESSRIALQKLALMDPLLRICAKRSTLALATTEQTAAQLRLLGAPHIEVQPAVALSDDEIRAIDDAISLRQKSTSSLTLLYVGRLIAWKGVHLGLRAMARASNRQLRYRIIGDGPLRGFLEAEAGRLGIADRVEFCGSLPREEVLRAYAKADALLYPSVHDSGGNAVIEAMAASLPVLCLAYGGPDHLITDDCGWKVHATTPVEAVERLTMALDHFAADAEERARRGQAARARCLTSFTWAARSEQMLLKLRS